MPSLHCLLCPATSPAQRAGQTLEENALCAAGIQPMKSYLHGNDRMFTLCPRFPRVLRRKGWDRQLCLSIRKARSGSNTYIKVT